MHSVKNFCNCLSNCLQARNFGAFLTVLSVEMMKVNCHEDGVSFRACDIRGGAKYGEVQGHGQAKENCY